VHGESLPGVGAAASALADDGGPAELLQVVAELLAPENVAALVST